MKIISFFLFMILVLSSQFIKSQTDTLIPITDSLYMYKPVNGCNGVFLITSQGVIVVDAMQTTDIAEKFIQQIRKKTDLPIKYLIFTHHHGDHTFGAPAFPKETIVIGQENILYQIEHINKCEIDKEINHQIPEAIKK